MLLLRSTTPLPFLTICLKRALLLRRSSTTSPCRNSFISKGSRNYSSLTNRHYATYDAAFTDSLREGGGFLRDFNLYFVHFQLPFLGPKS
jgi:hypothetical protein